ncbi:MAG: hypothetical protein HYX67_13010 [Candidatus Melainabacteria bacterium]|nr:hypothetical protein [Candidatus Melainabacteria bacterium]
MSSALLAIPKEIRLEIYLYLTKDLKELKGLNKSCKLVHKAPARQKGFTKLLKQFQEDVKKQVTTQKIELEQSNQNYAQCVQFEQKALMEVSKRASELATGNRYNLKNTKSEVKKDQMLRTRNSTEPTVLEFRKANKIRMEAQSSANKEATRLKFLQGVKSDIFVLLNDPQKQFQLTEKVLKYVFRTFPHLEDARAAEPVLKKLVTDCVEPPSHKIDVPFLDTWRANIKSLPPSIRERVLDAILEKGKTLSRPLDPTTQTLKNISPMGYFGTYRKLFVKDGAVFKLHQDCANTLKDPIKLFLANNAQSDKSELSAPAKQTELKIE